MQYFDFPQYNKNEIRKAGNFLSARLHYGPEAIFAFRVAHNWRDAHAYPMWRARAELRGKVIRGGNSGVTAARLKRMSSLRRKLRKSNIGLYRIQDIAGCRAILPDMASVDRVAGYYFDGDTPSKVVHNTNYTNNPKADGYRSNHIIIQPRIHDYPQFNKTHIEIQLRTRIQHSWATTVEAVGAVRGEKFKFGEGDPLWRRLFHLVSDDFMEEECGIFQYERVSRRQEIIDIANDIDAINTLAGYNQALHYADVKIPRSTPFYIVKLNLITHSVSVIGHPQYSRVSEEYNASEGRDENTDSVLVSVDSVDELREAFPNYFLDVRAFLEKLRAIVNSGQLISESAEVISSNIEALDYSWLGNWRRRRR